MDEPARRLGAEAAWQGELPLCAFAGDTLAVFAGVRGDSAAPVRLVSRGADGVDVVLAATTQRTIAADDALPRVAAAGRLASLHDEAATRLAVDYQLMSRFTNCVLVHQRAQAHRSVDEAQLHRIDNMLAAGWGATGSVMAERGGGARFDAMSAVAGAAPLVSAAPMMRKAAAASPELVKRRRIAHEPAGAPPHFDALDARLMGADVAPAREAPGSSGRLQDLAQTIRERLWKRAEVRAVMDRCRALGIFDAVGAAIDDVVRLGLSDPMAWALLVGWLDLRTGSDVYTSIPQGLQLRILRQGTGAIAAAHAVFDRRFAALDLAAA